MMNSGPMPSPDHQLQSIHAMLAAGHRSVRLERHSLLLIGAVGGFLSAVSEWVITTERFPDTEQRGLALLLWLTFWLGGVSLLDHWLTHRARHRRAETLPFAQAQMNRAWWMLLAMGCLGSFAMTFHGGGNMVYALWTVLLGLGIYLYGLFSRRLIEWIGLATILLGVTGLTAGLHYDTTRWLNASCFALGMPLAGWLGARFPRDDFLPRSLALLIWIAVVSAPPLALGHPTLVDAPEGSVIAPDSPQAADGIRIVHLPAGSAIALVVDMDSPILRIDPRAELTMTLSSPLDVVLEDGLPEGRYRIADGPWHDARQRRMRLRIQRVQKRLENGRPLVRVEASLGRRE